MSLQAIKKLLLSQEIRLYLQSQAIKHINIAGSFAHGNELKSSDIDLVVELDESRLTTSYFSLPRYLESKLGRRIDLIDSEYINPHIKPFLLSDIVPVW